jgi:hypothetical protein
MVYREALRLANDLLANVFMAVYDGSARKEAPETAKRLVELLEKDAAPGKPSSAR